jgi:hypothetical protein
MTEVEVVVYEDGNEVERRDLEADKYLVFTADDWHVSSWMVYPKSGTVSLTIKRRKTDEPTQ